MEIKAGEILDAAQPEATSAPSGAGEAVQETQKQPEAQAAQDPKLAGRLEILMRREQGLLGKEKSLKDLEAQIKEKLDLIERFEKAKSGNAKEALDLLGLNYNQLSEAILKDGAIPPEVEIKKLEDKLSQFEKQREEDKKAQEESQRLAREQAESKAVTDFKTEITTYIKDNKSRYELTNFEFGDEACDMVYEVVEEHWNRTLNPETGSGKVLSLKEAADKVEEFLEKKYAKAKEAEKIKALWGAIPPNAQATLAKQLSKTSQPPKTLTNNMTPAPQTKPPRPNEEQRVREIVAKFRAEKGL